MEKSGIEEMSKDIKEIKAALVGSIADKEPGLIEQQRVIKRDVGELQTLTSAHETQISEIVEFKKDAKKVVAGIAFVIPFAFELLKLGAGALWDLIKHAK